MSDLVARDPVQVPVPLHALVLSHFTDEPDIDLTRTYEQVTAYVSAYTKPVGLWLSDESDYGWSHWNDSERFIDTTAQTRLEFTVVPGANVLYLTTAEQVIGLADRYPGKASPSAYPGERPGSVDWRRVAGEYDGIMVTPYQWGPRLEDRARWYYGWDCASGCVWNLAAIRPAG